jgi:hypothetical protein
MVISWQHVNNGTEEMHNDGITEKGDEVDKDFGRPVQAMRARC